MTRWQTSPTDLFDDDAHILDRNARVVRVDDELEQVVAEHFEDHANVYGKSW